MEKGNIDSLPLDGIRISELFCVFFFRKRENEERRRGERKRGGKKERREEKVCVGWGRSELRK